MFELDFNGFRTDFLKSILNKFCCNSNKWNSICLTIYWYPRLTSHPSAFSNIKIYNFDFSNKKIFKNHRVLLTSSICILFWIQTFVKYTSVANASSISWGEKTLKGDSTLCNSVKKYTVVVYIYYTVRMKMWTIVFNILLL